MKKSLLVTLLLSSVLGLGAVTNEPNVNAAKHHVVKKAHKKKAHHQQKQTKHKHKQGEQTVKASIDLKSDDQSNSNSNSDDQNNNTNSSIVNNATYEQQYRAEALKEINALRASVGVSPVVEDPTLDKIADQRVAQNMARSDGSISHYDSNGNALGDEDAKQYGINDGLSENLAERGYESGDPSSPTEVANELTHQYIDEGPEANDGKEHGHYENLVSPINKSIGIGFGISSNADSEGFKNLYDAEDFSFDTNPTSAQSQNDTAPATTTSTNGQQATSTNSNSAVGSVSTVPQNNADWTYQQAPGGDWVGTPTPQYEQEQKNEFYATHHIETSSDGEQVYVKNGMHLQFDASGQGTAVPNN
ncbi:CAP domain-containing protein [Lactobacillus sp. Sy-1]|uniref:CAP domain-containing protein n=1 Tax=Lactobacillus sp. Sy-1 TaxID=2109645 RepID=UPI001C5B7827|nr:CAP domain-containing protein [Lactobacillus sp. Sy-1]MBW1606355.1 CAP domain-containing protein [Lactobacillus sp. Sy-1]